MASLDPENTRGRPIDGASETCVSIWHPSCLIIRGIGVLRASGQEGVHGQSSLTPYCAKLDHDNDKRCDKAAYSATDIGGRESRILISKEKQK
jgi:hypothetical protein